MINLAKQAKKDWRGMELLGRLDTEAGLVAEGRAPGEPNQPEPAEGGAATVSDVRSAPETSGGFDRWPGGLTG